MTKHFPIPDSIFDAHVDLFGMTGSGKSYLTRSIGERLLKKRERVCWIDPTDVAWGIRLQPNGRTPSPYKPVIFGGPHGDLPLTEAHGTLLAEVVGTGSTSTIISTRHLSTRQRTRFFIDFAEGLLQKNRGRLHLFIDEAHLFAPKGRVNSNEAGEMLSATNNLVSLGRGAGLTVILITQRPAKLHNDAASCALAMIALRAIHPRDREAVEDWIGEVADDDKKGSEILKSLSGLPTGTGWVWAPVKHFLHKLDFPTITTFDSMKPEKNRKRARKLKPIDVAKLSDQMKAVTAAIKENDPTALKAKVRDLEAKLAKAKTPVVKEAADPKAIEKARAEGRQIGASAAYKAFLASFKTPVGKISDLIDGCKRELQSIDKIKTFDIEFKVPPKATGVYRGSPATLIADIRADGKVKIPPKPRTFSGLAPAANGKLPAGERAILMACAQHETTGCTHEQIAVLTGYKATSRRVYLQRLKQRGYLETAGDHEIVTQEGVAALGYFEPLPTGAALYDHWLRELPDGESKILRFIMETVAHAASVEKIGVATNYKATSLRVYLQRLAARKLVNKVKDQIYATDILFD